MAEDTEAFYINYIYLRVFDLDYDLELGFYHFSLIFSGKVLGLLGLEVRALL